MTLILPWLQPCLKTSVWDLDRMKTIHEACRQAVWKNVRHFWTWANSGVSRQTGNGRHRQTRKKRETWKLTNCFWSLWKSTTRDWFVWALALGRVKIDPDAMTRRKQNEIKMEKKEGVKGKSRGFGGGVRESISESQESKWWKKSAALQLIGKDEAEVW